MRSIGRMSRSRRRRNRRGGGVQIGGTIGIAVIVRTAPAVGVVIGETIIAPARILKRSQRTETGGVSPDARRTRERETWIRPDGDQRGAAAVLRIVGIGR